MQRVYSPMIERKKSLGKRFLENLALGTLFLGVCAAIVYPFFKHSRDAENLMNQNYPWGKVNVFDSDLITPLGCYHGEDVKQNSLLYALWKDSVLARNDLEDFTHLSPGDTLQFPDLDGDGLIAGKPYKPVNP